MRSQIFALFLLSPLALVACGVAETIDQDVDCRNVCDRYQSCYDSSYDTAACRDRCHNVVDGDGGRSYAANECDTCMDDRSCAAAVFGCAAPCAGILP